MSNLDEKDAAVKLAAINLQKALNGHGGTSRQYDVSVTLNEYDVTVLDSVYSDTWEKTKKVYFYTVRVTKIATEGVL